MENHQPVRCVTLFCTLVLVAGNLLAATDTIMLLYTSDLHDHIRVSAGGKGGMPCVAAHVRKVRAGRKDTLLVDAGDVVNKGDCLPFATQGRSMYEAMRKIGYTAAAPGNHDFVYGLPQLLQNAEAGGFPVLCANVMKNDGSSVPLQRSVLVDVDGVKVGIIGFTLAGAVFEKAGCRALDANGTAAELKKEADKLAADADVIIAVGHYPNQKCRQLAKVATEIDVFVAAHNHQVLRTPTKIPETGALVIQAGANAQHVGELELTIDMDTKKIVSHRCKVVALDPKSAPPEQHMVQWIEEREADVCPQASEVLGGTDRSFDARQLARLYAASMRAKAGADAALFNPNRLLGGLPAGDAIDRNALFATYMMQYPEVVTVEISGEALIAALGRIKSQNDVPVASGFAAKFDFRQPAGKQLTETSLDPGKRYVVVLNDLPDRVGSPTQRLGLHVSADTAQRCDFSPPDALAAHIRALAEKGERLQ